MLRILLVRHGQVKWNVAGAERFRGRADLDLDPLGVEQARALARHIRDRFAVDAIYTSPLRRAVQTAEAIGQESGAAVQVLEGLNDLDYGEWEGLAPAEVAQRYPEEFEQWRTCPNGLRIPGGEAFPQARERALAAVEGVVARHPEGAVVLVTHTTMCRILLCALLGLGTGAFWQIVQDNTALNVVRRSRDRYVIELINDTCHLRDLSQIT